MIWGLIAMVIAGIFGAILFALAPKADAIALGPLVIESIPVAEEKECLCDDCCYDEAYLAYADEFTALFNAMEYKRAKNGASMIRRPGDKSFKFVAKGN